MSTTDLQKEPPSLRDRPSLSWRAAALFKVTGQNWGVCCSYAHSSLALRLKHCYCQAHSFMGLCSGAVLACFFLLKGRDCTCHLAVWVFLVFISRYINWILYFLQHFFFTFFFFFLIWNTSAAPLKICEKCILIMSTTKFFFFYSHSKEWKVQTFSGLYSVPFTDCSMKQNNAFNVPLFILWSIHIYMYYIWPEWSAAGNSKLFLCCFVFHMNTKPC